MSPFEMPDLDRYNSPLSGRYASEAMQAIWSPRRRYTTWRRLWLALAESQAQLGLDISPEQLSQLRAHVEDIDLEAAAAYEQKLRHDVMAHVHVLGDQAPAARPIIHLGATSQYINCNTELLQVRDALTLIAAKTAAVIDALGTFCATWRDTPTLGLTHYQPAQPTTVGKRATLWAQDLALGLEDLEHRIDTLRFRGVRGATGTQASFLDLFEGDAEKVEQLDMLVTEKMDWPADRRYAVTGQTYPRVVDAQVLSALAAIAAATHKCATDLRLLCSLGEIEEPIEQTQIGSSAMPYKRNPMRCERICSLARYVMCLPQSALDTAATQWMERTLDDSANRRIVLPEAFLALDGVLDVLRNVASGMVVHEATVAANLAAHMPFLATERMLMEAVRNGADRQDAHEVIRRHAHEVALTIRDQAAPNDLLERLASEPLFAGVDTTAAMNPAGFVGRAPTQVDAFLADIVEPIRDRYASGTPDTVELRV